jgi:outer membrane lipoprotein-sorting protein
MKFGWKRPVFWAMGAAMVCLLGVVSVRAQALANPGDGPQTTDTLFKNILVLKGMRIDTFFDAMGMFAASMGDDCTYCHSKKAVLDRDAFAEATPRIQRARQMIVMMQTLNKTYFGGEPKVTCFTCHRGAYTPANSPRFSLQYGTPDDDPNVMNFIADTRTSPDQILDKYLQALGGAGALAKITSFTAKGTYAGFDTGDQEIPVEIFAKAPNQRTWIIQTLDGPSYRVYDGTNAWWAGPDAPSPIQVQTSGNLDRARLETLVAFPSAIKQAFTSWKVGRTAIDDLDVTIVQGTKAGLLPVNFYFDNATGLLVRIVRWNETPVGPVPTQLEYSDYRDVAGVKMPFSWVMTQTYMQATINLSDVQPNVAIDAARFTRPTPVPR